MIIVVSNLDKWGFQIIFQVFREPHKLRNTEECVDDPSKSFAYSTVSDKIEKQCFLTTKKEFQLNFKNFQLSNNVEKRGILST